MVKGTTYYAKFTKSGIDFTDYSGTYSVIKDNKTIVSGNMTKLADGFEVSIPTLTFSKGTHRFICLVTYPDGYVECISDENQVVN